MSAKIGGRVLSRACCLWVIIGLLALPAQARYGGGLGTAGQPYLISTAAQLNAIGAEPGDWDKCFKLTANIDLRDLGTTPFRRIGTLHGGSFVGVFDGNYKTISNLRLYSEDESYLAMFGIVDGAGARIVNVTLLDPNVAGDYGRYVAALVGLITDGTIANCHVRGGTVRGTSLVGGLIAGRARGAAVTDCTAAGTVRGSSRVGGLIGGNLLGDVTRCQAAAAVWGDASSWSVGGLIGENESGTVTACRACSTVEGNDSVGGLIGKNITAAVSGCGAEGMVQASTNAGGLIGQHAGGKITDCYAGAGVIGTTAAGGLVGYLGPSCGCVEYIPGLVARSYAAGPVTGVGAVVAHSGAHGVRPVRSGCRVVVTRGAQVEPAGVPTIPVDVPVNRVPPAVRMVHGRAVPAAVLALQHRRVPVHAGVGVGVEDALTGEAGRPDGGGADLLHVPLHSPRGGGGRRPRLGGDSREGTVGLDRPDVVTSGERREDVAVAGHRERVHDPEPPVRHAELSQGCADARLAGRRSSQRRHGETALRRPVARDGGRRADVRLPAEYDEELRRPATGRVGDDPRVDLRGGPARGCAPAHDDDRRRDTSHEHGARHHARVAAGFGAASPGTHGRGAEARVERGGACWRPR